MRWIAGFGNCDNVPAAHDPGQRNRGCRATMRSADLRQRAVTHEAGVFDRRRAENSRHHRHIVLLRTMAERHAQQYGY